MVTKNEQFGKRGYPGQIAKMRIRIEAQRRVCLATIDRCRRIEEQLAAVLRRLDAIEPVLADLAAVTKRRRPPRGNS
ncbi:MAG TPA: hypothetical protein VFJ24_08370 [Gaiellales bacterium]|nr:hypothetical protein [Gaiellales bacterium]